MQRKLTLLICTCALLALTVTANAAPWYAVTDRLGYTGTVSVYNTLGDAQAGTNARGETSIVPQRDAAVYFVKGVPDVWSDSAIFMTSWYYTTADNTNGLLKDDPNGNKYYSGSANPSNTNTGFVQLYDDNYSTVISESAGWTSSAYDTFSLTISGENAGVDDTARLWHAPNTSGAAEVTKGTFLNWTLNMTATGLAGQDADGDGFYISSGHPAAVSGSFYGIFKNESATFPDANGYYVFDLSLNMDNWSYAQGNEALNGDLYPSEFGAQAVPEPMSFVLGAMGLSSLLGFKKLRKS